MEKLIKGKVKIDEIIVDPEIYPRTTHYWQTAYIYSEAMKQGAKFPPIVVAIHNGKKYLIDGKHRIEAAKICKKDKIDAHVYSGWSWNKMFEQAIMLNVAHGVSLTAYDKARIALKLRAMKYGPAKISALIQVPIGKLSGFLAQRVISTPVGSLTSGLAVKKGIKIPNKVYTEAEVMDLGGKQEDVDVDQERLIKQFQVFLGDHLFDLDNPKISGGLIDIRDSLNQLDLQ